MKHRRRWLQVASAGNGTSGHLAGELLAQRLRGRMIHVPYKEGAVRSSAARDVPTLMEQGVQDFDLVAWFMLYAPAAIPASTLAQLRSAGYNALAQPDVVARLHEQGIEPRALKTDELAPFNQAEVGKWAQLVKRSGAQVD